MKKFNINNTMYIHILPKGLKYLKNKYGDEYVNKGIKPQKVMIGHKEYYSLQCWNLFNTLPASMGFDMLFEPIVLFKDSDLENVDIDK